MRTEIICVGKIKEKFFKDAISEYSKRLSKYVNLNIIEVSDEKTPESLSDSEKRIVKYKEGERILNAVKTNFVIALDLSGKKLSSENFAEFLRKSMVSGINGVSFVIGGSLGLSESVIKRADLRLSFSDMTFPHQLMRVILLEQIYRAHRIINNEPYHK
ncbi:MAG: 23S rRNA (pseudouridine(1915)-N(3))-methyltransferase RlmH [Clostridiales bacterium]|jgi:23S rRNA (pseudouridine1915-N3)-methyltransferase|nr:23S rRNA (pseudouridine(1915)-N(3))-methyltransferase RlmH [Clostridiales bacterium]